ncbi:MAG: hypothetical protein QM770_11910 [Tepidisphaeraceae bacterium]
MIRERIVAGVMIVCSVLVGWCAAAPAVPYDWSNVAIKGNGFINGIVFSPVEKDLVYIYTDMGGACRWDASAKRWMPLNDWSLYTDPAARNLGVEALAADPVDANRVYMVIGTYDSPASVCRSSDRGATWQRTDLDGKEGRPLVRANGNGPGRNGGNRLAIDPNDPKRLWFGSRMDGLWKSVDAGVTWTKVESFQATGDTTGPAKSVGIVWLLVGPSSAKRGVASRALYAGVSTSSPQKAFRSVDGGTTWSVLPGQPTDTDLLPIRAAITPDGSKLLLTYSDNPGPNSPKRGEVFAVDAPSSVNPSWKKLDLPKLGDGGWSAVCIDPSNANQVVVSTLGRWGAQDDVYRSTDGGATWSPLVANKHRDDTSAPYATKMRLHWIGDVQIDPFDSSHAMLTTGYGLYDTRELANVDKGEPVTWSFFNDGFEQTAALELASPFDGPVHLFSAIGDRDGFRHVDFNVSPIDGRLGESTDLARGTCWDIDIAQEDSNKLVRVLEKTPFVQFSDDNGVTWKWIGNEPKEKQPRHAGSAAISADGIRIIYSPRGQHSDPGDIVFTTREGDQWTPWSLAQGNVPRDAVVLVDLGDARTFYAHVGTGIWRSTDAGEHWSKQTGELPRPITWVRAVPGRAGHLFASTRDNGGLWRSTDSGANWSRVSAEHVSDAYAVGVGAPMKQGGYPSVFVFGTIDGEPGYFRSDDEGQSWVRINDDQHQFGWITVIQGDPRMPGRLYVGSNGRGVLVADPRR